MRRFSGTKLIIEQDREAALMQVSVWETVQVRRAGSSVEYDERSGLARFNIAKELIVRLVRRSSIGEVEDTLCRLGGGHGRS